MEFKMATFLKNGIRVKTQKNRSVSVWQHPNSDMNGIIIEFRRADVPPDQVGKNPVNYKVLRKRAELTGVAISRTAAMALYYALNDYFERVSPLSKEEKSIENI